MQWAEVTIDINASAISSQWTMHTLMHMHTLIGRIRGRPQQQTLTMDIRGRLPQS